MKKIKPLTIIIIILSMLLVCTTVGGITITVIYCAQNGVDMYILSFHVVHLMYLILGASMFLVALIAILYQKRTKMRKEALRANCWSI